MNCTHPDHNEQETCEDRAVGCHPDCTCCVPKDPSNVDAAYTILASKRDDVEAKIAKLNKRAVRLGVEPIQLAWTHCRMEVQIKQPQAAGMGPLNKLIWVDKEQYESGRKDEKSSVHDTRTGLVREWLTLTITGSTPHYDGWTFCGTLEPLSLENGTAENLLLCVPGEKIPFEFSERVGCCDHCNKQRKRSQTFVVRNEANEYKCVGRQCVADFLGGQAPQNIARHAELWGELNELCEAEESDNWGSGGGYSPSCWSLDHFLSWTLSSIRATGWVSRKMAYESMLTSTASHVIGLLCPHPSDTKEVRKERAELEPTVENRETAELVIQWIKEQQDPDNEYITNLNLISRVGYVTHKTAGLAASMIVCFNKAMDKETERRKRAERPVSNHIGQLKERLELTVTCLGVIEKPSEFGVTGIHKMIDSEGNDLTWFATGDGWLEPNKKYRVKATVKKHDEYQGRKQTIVNRVTIIKEVEE